MVSVRYPLPNFTIQDAQQLAMERYGLRASASPLPSERDQNFYLISESGEEYVLKIANVTEDREVLELQNDAMAHLAEKAPSLAIPRVCLTKSGESISVVESPQQEKHFLRMLTYIPAKLLAKVRPHTSELLRSLGHVLGTIDHALQSFEDPA